MISTILRSVIIYVIVLILIRLMGKRQIAQMQPFELVITLIIADLATIPMSDTSIPLLHGIIPLLTLTVLHFFITSLSCKSLRIRSFVNGKPVIIIGPNGIQEEALKSLNMNINDLLESCRYANFHTLSDIQYAILETNGNLSIIPKAAATPATQMDIAIKNEDPSLNVVLISDGKISYENLSLLNISEKEILQLLKKQQINSVSDVLILIYNQTGEIYLQQKNKAYLSLIQTLGGGES